MECVIRLLSCIPSSPALSRSGPILNASPSREEEEVHPTSINYCGDVGNENVEGETATSIRQRLHERRSFWEASMHQMGLGPTLVRTITLSIITGGRRIGYLPRLPPYPLSWITILPPCFRRRCWTHRVLHIGPDYVGQILGRDDLHPSAGRQWE